MKKVVSVLLVIAMLVALLCTGASAKTEEPKTAKNVIIMIGDGMGMNHIKWTEKTYNRTMFMSGLPYQGWSKTNSWSGTTDSAAGGTAPATGKHTFNGNVGCVGFDLNDHSVVLASYMNLCELAKNLGKKAGVLTSDSNSGATPAAFTVHVGDRGLSEEICKQQLASNFDLIWSKPDSHITESNCSAAGWTYVDSWEDVTNLQPGTKSFGQFNSEIEYSSEATVSTPSLSKLTVKAIEQLKCDKGFFLMIEGAHIDKKSHNNEAENMFKALDEFDNCIEEAVKFAREDGNTIVIVTADHETGAIVYDNGSSNYKFTSKSHSSANVPVLVYGTDEFVKDGKVVVNTETGVFAAKMLGAEGALPAVTLNPDFFSDFFKALFSLFEKK